jgi:putative inorganic carbon (HCO3(-)) transporter
VAGRIGLACAVLLMAAILLLTKSRGGYLAGAAGGLVVAWLSLRRRWALALTLLVVALGVWLLLVSEGEAPEIVEEAVDPSTWFFRLRVWRAALQMLCDQPFTGVGMGVFNDLAAALYAFVETANPGAHNLYVQVAVDLGIPGLIAYLSVLGLALWMAAVAVRRGEPPLRAPAVGALAGVVALMVHGLVDVTVWNTRAAFVPWLVFGLVVVVYRQVATVQVR